MKFVPLRAGPLTLALDPACGALRYIFAGPHEVCRGINAPVRDVVWRTVQPEVSDLKVTQRLNSFQVTFHVRCRSDLVDFRWTGTIAGSAEGSIDFEFDGEALREFARNRIGFCVLHPASSAGFPIRVEHTDGRVEDSLLPEVISPHQPFYDVRALTHTFAPGLRAQVRFEGDTFEMEDQRNWTDASFKTYCTPLARPRPVLLAPGTRIRQRVTLRLLGENTVALAATLPWIVPREVNLDLAAESRGTLPPLGTQWRGESTPEIIGALRPLRLSHLRIELWLAGTTWREALQQGASAAFQLDAALEFAVLVGDNAHSQLRELRDALATCRRMPRIARWIIFHENLPSTPPECIIAWRDVFAATPFLAVVGGGVTDNFTELNRGREVATVADFTVHACNPQVHACDECSLVETLPIQGQTVAAARRLSCNRPAVVSPVTFTPRDSSATEPIDPRPKALRPFRYDARLASPFAAAWSLGSIAALATAGAASLTYFEAFGANGLFEPNAMPRPVHRVFELLSPWANARVYPLGISHPSHVTALAVETNDRRGLIAATFGSSSHVLRVTGAWGERTLTVGPTPALTLFS